MTFKINKKFKRIESPKFVLNCPGCGKFVTATENNYRKFCSCKILLWEKGEPRNNATICADDVMLLQRGEK
jgi:endogenous inhibitor of DNA gyrase (YacG/DUF329 family)